MTEQRKRRKETRLTPLGRFMLTWFFIVITALTGALIGYSLIGTGNPIDVFLPDTWIHLFDVVVKSLF
ncbi:DNA-directed RNA polymerase subunit beta [Domibacillus epiphyticus]|uniref:DNA-directed RNA polymerase subunit beta n=1 Tax=Domibacillus epiphyticus TaxID=1714355 RepID=A0A1V2A6Z2_9BACI|nr:DNA-directed RNA polymerase subunit beta [Domibacillus epiphyticus]OMP66604.1 hypothetical protein BTO28_11180 [Domibacillus epiphyticus]